MCGGGRNDIDGDGALAVAFVTVLDRKGLVATKTDPLACPLPLYSILSNACLPLNSPFPPGFTIFKLTTTSSPHPLPSPPDPPARMSASSPPSCVNRLGSKSYSFVRRPLTSVEPEDDSDMAQLRKPRPDQDASSV